MGWSVNQVEKRRENENKGNGVRLGPSEPLKQKSSLLFNKNVLSRASFRVFLDQKIRKFL